jgi:hypothetical protein
MKNMVIIKGIIIMIGEVQSNDTVFERDHLLFVLGSEK